MNQHDINFTMGTLFVIVLILFIVSLLAGGAFATDVLDFIRGLRPMCS